MDEADPAVEAADFLLKEIDKTEEEKNGYG